MQLSSDWQHCDFSLLKKLSPNLAQWLIKPERLTRHLKQSVQHYQLKCLSQSLRPATKAEQQILQSDNAQLWERKIAHCSGEQTLIQASVMVSERDYRLHQATFDQLSNLSIGEHLFYNNDKTQRSHFEYAQINGQWARRSIFTWQNCRIIVTEIFSSDLPPFIAQHQPAKWQQKIKALGRMMRLHKPLPILLALWPTYWGLWLAADGMPSLKILIIFTLGGLLMRSAGCIFNDIADRHADRLVERTQQRPITAGIISAKTAALFAGLLCIVAYILVLQCNRLTVYFAWIGLALTLIYPLLKRVTHLPQLGLGFAFNWGIIMAFAAVQNTVPLLAWPWYVAAIIWTLAYDTLYAWADVKDDVKVGIKSTAVLFGKHIRLAIIILQLTMLSILALLGQTRANPVIFYSGLILCLCLFAKQHLTTRIINIKNCIKAFSDNHWVGLIIFLMIAFT